MLRSEKYFRKKIIKKIKKSFQKFFYLNLFGYIYYITIINNLKTKTMKKIVLIFRKSFRPTPAQEVTETLFTKVISDRSKAMAIPTAFGVMTICETEKSVEEIESILATNCIGHKFLVTDITPENMPGMESNSTTNSVELSLDDLLGLISENGLNSLTDEQKARLEQLSGNA